MTITRLAALGGCLAVLALAAAPALAEDLPDICGSVPEMDHPMMSQVPISSDEAHAALMQSMTSMSGMGVGMMAEDIDDAFICGMIPHHQGAIDMAKAVLDYGDDPWVKQLAQTIIDAQTAEIAAMRDWLARQ
ncbi:MAG: DUF305 domain-containing protein [Alphaproteobacteria bacterium]|nr:DUF305 domain-containing protein [Alphaproteobacteria bacterium]